MKFQVFEFFLVIVVNFLKLMVKFRNIFLEMIMVVVFLIIVVCMGIKVGLQLKLYSDYVIFGNFFMIGKFFISFFS